MRATPTTSPGRQRGGRVHTEPGPPNRLVPWLVGAGLAVAVASSVLVGFRGGGLLLAFLLAAAAAARLLLPVRVVGALAVRSRPVDVVTLTGLALAVAVLALTAPGG